jgi:multicomponent Na+:H+ antiporter subunit D
VLVGSLLAVLYIGRVAEAAYLKPAPEREEPVREAPLGLLLPMYVLIAANFWFGIDTRLTLDVATHGAELLVGGAP